ncbi:olfactory receptor 14A2-like [Tachyglossus aculeatus]|uniref:olfactory receptor 14A2-like n=1 Tax=Tachyglossus aculeatus TaxID=9261 RepID=UPI0018F3E74C|nr:olfactory receptor 14A2-like [Tachyglossus aculeatus]
MNNTACGASPSPRLARSISFLGCVTQVFLVVFFGGAEYFVLTITCSEGHVAVNVSITASATLCIICFILIIVSYARIFRAILRMPSAEELFILSAMSHDPYAAVCLPPSYEVVMAQKAYQKLATDFWFSGGLFAAMITCSEKNMVIDATVTFRTSLGIVWFSSITFSYMRVFRAMLRMPVTEGRAKAFSTCLAHLTVFTVLLFAGVFTYIKPPSDSSLIVDLLVPVLYTLKTLDVDEFSKCGRECG